MEDGRRLHNPPGDVDSQKDFGTFVVVGSLLPKEGPLRVVQKVML